MCCKLCLLNETFVALGTLVRFFSLQMHVLYVTIQLCNPRVAKLAVRIGAAVQLRAFLSAIGTLSVADFGLLLNNDRDS